MIEPIIQTDAIPKKPVWNPPTIKALSISTHTCANGGAGGDGGHPIPIDDVGNDNSTPQSAT